MGCICRLSAATGKLLAAFVMHMTRSPQAKGLVANMWVLGKQMDPEECDLINSLFLGKFTIWVC